MMSKTKRDSLPDDKLPIRPTSATETNVDWQHVEDFVAQLHELSRAPIEPDDYYRQLLNRCVTLLAAEAGTVWLPAGRGRWQPTYQVHSEPLLEGSDASVATARASLLRRAATSLEPLIVPPGSRTAAGAENPTSAVLVLTAIVDTERLTSESSAQAIIEISLQPGAGPSVEQGWRQLMMTVSQLAGEFHSHHQLRTLRSERQFYDQSLALMRRLQQSRGLRPTGFDIANEGRRFVGADRLSVILRRGRKWRLLAVSGVDQVDTRSDAAQRLQKLAGATADWGEPLEYTDARAADALDAGSEDLAAGPFHSEPLPPALEELIERHVDESHARRLAAVPIELELPDEQKSTSCVGRQAAAVFIAEQFHSESVPVSRQRLQELALLCGPALRQAQQLDRLPIRFCLRGADRWAKMCEAWGLTKMTVAVAAALTVLAVLVMVPCDFEVEAPATLKPLVERDVFATTDGKIVQVNISHGQYVEANDVLAVLHDPQLLLDAQRVEGDIATTRKRLEAITVARTDRKVREDMTNEELPLSAEAEQLKKRLVSLWSQQAIYADRREALTVRSPIAGKVLTHDVQNLLLTRPVQRGQVLFTVADTTAGWHLSTEMPQDRIRQVVAAQQSGNRQLPARFRLAGATDQTFNGHVESISTTVLLDAAELDHAGPPFEIVVAVDEAELPLARPGMSAQVRIACGRRSLGYVWLHDIWDALYSYFIF